MKQWIGIIAATALLAGAAQTAIAAGTGGLEGKRGLPAKVSQLDGWHGAKLEQRDAPLCKLVLPRDFGRSPADFRLQQQLAERGWWDLEQDTDCDSGTAPHAAWDQMKRLAVADQNRAAAELVVYALQSGKVDHLGDFAEGFGEAYIYPVLLGYDRLAELIPPQKELAVATDVCTTYLNPSTGPGLDFNGLIKRLKAHNMQSLVSKIDRECARIRKEGYGDNG